MKLAPSRRFLSSGVLATWLGVDFGTPIGSVDEKTIKRVTSLIGALVKNTWLAIDTSISEIWFAGLADLGLPKSHRKLVNLLKGQHANDLWKLKLASTGGWEHLSDRIDDVIDDLIRTSPTIFWCKPGEEGLSLLSRELPPLFEGINEIDVFDPYLLNNLQTSSRTVDPSLKAYARNRYVQTLDYVCAAIVNEAAISTVNLRCPILAESDKQNLDRYDPENEKSVSECFPGMNEILRSLSEKYSKRVRFRLDVRIERERFDHGRMDMSGEWFHGRYIVIPNICVISSDRSMDFIALRHSSIGGEPIEQIGTVDNMLVRWPFDTLSPEHLLQQWSGLRRLFRGPELIDIGC